MSKSNYSIAEQLARSNDDGQSWTTDGQDWRELLEATAIQVDRQSDQQRYRFADGSTIVTQRGCWDVGFSSASDDCWCWPQSNHGHNDDCPAAGSVDVETQKHREA